MQNESVDTRYAPFLNYWETLPPKWVEGMPDLDPPQRLTVLMCSSR